MTSNISVPVCPAPFLNEANYGQGGYLDGRLCLNMCCLPCPMTNWAYPDSFAIMVKAADWVAILSLACCIFLLLSWAFLPVEMTHRHYLSICLTSAVILMNMGFVIPLAGQPEQCFDDITPNNMQTSPICAASGSLLILGGWASVLWVFLRALSLHLQICWQLVVGQTFMWISQGLGWGLPALGIVFALIMSGVSFRFGATCHINHRNSLADLWIPLLVLAGLTIIIQFATFGYCLKVYLASLAEDNATTKTSAGLPCNSNSIRTMTPQQAYRRVRRVVQLQWRGLAIVLIITTDVIFFAVVFVLQDKNTMETVTKDPTVAMPWIGCLMAAGGAKTNCFDKANSLVVNTATSGAILVLLAMNGIWLLVLLGRWSMVTAWIKLLTHRQEQKRREFVSFDARLDDLKMNKDPRSHEICSRNSGKSYFGLVTSGMAREGPPCSPLRTYLDSMASPPTVSSATSEPRTPDGSQALQYQPPMTSFSSPRPPTRAGQAVQSSCDAKATHTSAPSSYQQSQPQLVMAHAHQGSLGPQDLELLGMNKI